MFWGVLMKTRHEDWRVLKTARVVEHVWLGRALMQQGSSSLREIAPSVEPRALDRAKWQRTEQKLYVLCAGFCGLLSLFS